MGHEVVHVMELAAAHGTAGVEVCSIMKVLFRKAVLPFNSIGAKDDLALHIARNVHIAQAEHGWDKIHKAHHAFIDMPRSVGTHMLPLFGESDDHRYMQPLLPYPDLSRGNAHTVVTEKNDNGVSIQTIGF